MADIDKLKEVADLLAEQAQSLLKRDGVLSPILFSFSTIDARPIPIGVKLETDQDKDMLAALMKVVAKMSKGIIFLTDAYVRTAKPDEDMENLKEPVRNHPDAVEAIMLTVYVKGASAFKQIIYVSDNGNYTFTDMGWADATDMVGRFDNPYGNSKAPTK
jgi:hypothetical protein